MSHRLRICVGPTCGVNFSNDCHCEEGPNLLLNGTVHVDMTPDQLRGLVAALPAMPLGMEMAR